MQKPIITVAAVGDLHCTRTSHGRIQPIFSGLVDRADVIALCGDLTDLGTLEEAKILVSELAPAVGIPKVAVLGNHDYESGHQEEVKKVLQDAGVMVLDGEAVEIMGIGFAGVKGFAGGFGRRMLAPWGEPALKEFVNEGVREGIKLESALGKLRAPSKVVLTHYAPIKDTVVGEPLDIFPWLGCSRLEEAINRLGATVVFHGHAHRGSLEGQTREGIPVYNVAAPLLRSSYSEALPVRFTQLALSGGIVSHEPFPNGAKSLSGDSRSKSV